MKSKPLGFRSDYMHIKDDNNYKVVAVKKDTREGVVIHRCKSVAEAKVVQADCYKKLVDDDIYDDVYWSSNI